jgi:hypothetical protein
MIQECDEETIDRIRCELEQYICTCRTYHHWWSKYNIAYVLWLLPRIRVTIPYRFLLVMGQMEIGRKPEAVVYPKITFIQQIRLHSE